MTGMSITHRQHQHHQRVQTSMAAAGTVAAAAGARDETRLEPLVCFFILFIMLMFILDVLDVSTYEGRCQAWQGRETRAGDKQGGSRHVASRAQCVCRRVSMNHILFSKVASSSLRV